MVNDGAIMRRVSASRLRGVTSRFRAWGRRCWKYRTSVSVRPAYTIRLPG